MECQARDGARHALHASHSTARTPSRTGGRCHTGPVPQWLVLADDRSGALEVAGELADRLGPVRGRRPLVTGAARGGESAAVVDLGESSRVVDLAGRRRRRAAAVVGDRGQRRHRLHKIDSTLRGRWADELVAVQRHDGCRVLVVAALPRLGRTCIGGVVHVDGTPLQLDDVRHGRAPARPADVLAAAGAGDVVELTIADAGRVARRRRRSRSPCATRRPTPTSRPSDVSGGASTGVVFAGTSGQRRRRGAQPQPPPHDAALDVTLARPAVVVGRQPAPDGTGAARRVARRGARRRRRARHRTDAAQRSTPIAADAAAAAAGRRRRVAGSRSATWPRS